MYFNQAKKKLGPNMSYVLGVCESDGSVWQETLKGKWFKEPRKTYCIELRVKDKEFINVFAKKLTSLIRRPNDQKINSIFKTKNNMYRYVKRSLSFGNFYKNKKNWEDIVYSNPKDFLRAFYNSDGNLSINKKTNYPTIRIFKCSVDKLKMVSRCLNIIGIKNKIGIFRKSHSKTNMCDDTKELLFLRIDGNEAIKFLKFVGSDIRRKSMEALYNGTL